MPLSQPIQDYLESLGTSIAEQGLPSRRFSPKGATFVSSALTGIAAGIHQRRALDTLRRLERQQADFEARTGVPYSLFSKLGSEAQRDILERTGVIEDPLSGSLPDTSVTGREFMRTGLPAKVAEPLGPTESGEPLPPVTLSPAIPPGVLLTPEMRSKALISRYLGVEPPSPMDQARLDLTGVRKRIADRELYNLEHGLTRSGGTPGGAARDLTPWQRRQVSAWLSRPENAGRTEDDAIAALTFQKPFRLMPARDEFGATVYENPDGSRTSDLSRVQPGAVALMVDPYTGTIVRGEAANVGGPSEASIIRAINEERNAGNLRAYLYDKRPAVRAAAEARYKALGGR